MCDTGSNVCYETPYVTFDTAYVNCDTGDA